MHACAIESYGGPDVLVPTETPEPQVQDGWTVVELRAAALNWHDVLVRQGVYETPLPHIIGADGAGVRRDTGQEVVILPSLWWGEREAAPGPKWEILGDHRPGTYAELVAVPTDCVLPRPTGLSWQEAAALPLVGLTTFRALFTRGRLQADEWLLVLGAGGGLATMAVTLAASIGANVVVTSSADWKLDRAHESGAIGGVLYTAADWVEAATALTPSGRGFDVVLDSVGSWADSAEALRPGGRLVVVGATATTKVEMPVRSFYFGQYDLLGSTMGSPRDFGGLLRLLGETRPAPPPVHATYPLAAAATAHADMEAGDYYGKLVLLP